MAGEAERLSESPVITQADVDEAVGRLSARRAAGIGPRGNTLYDLDRLAEAVAQCDDNIKRFETAIEDEEQRRRDLKQLLRDQKDIQERLQRGEYVDGYSPKRE